MAFSAFGLKKYHSELFAGNPPAVCPLTAWPPYRAVPSIAAENKKSENARAMGAMGILVLGSGAFTAIMLSLFQLFLKGIS